MPSDDLGRNLITPQDQTLRQVFSAQRSYFIDIYQREYKWKDDNVQALLNDIEVRFNKHQRLAHDAKDIAADVLARFEPYFLNTYLTHSTPSRTYVVDGQQRLTTLLLILIKLYRILQVTEESPEPHPRVFSSKKLEQLIFESDDLGDATRFKIFNENREEAFRALIAGKYAESKDETRRRIAENFGVVSRYLDAFLQSGSDGSYDYVKLNYYLVYLLDRVSIVEIRIERQDNVAMIFEVVNDRGLGLKPYEILKGKLLGTLSAEEKETANRIWTDLQERYFAVELKNTTDKTLDLDSFFQTYFRAKFADTETEYDRFEGSYHYEMYKNPRIREYFGDFQNRGLLYQRLTQDIRYFADLYLRLRTSYEEEFLIFNKLLDQNQQYLLILAAITLDDSNEKQKTRAIARKFDQLHVLLRLLDTYDSNSFQRLLYPLSANIRGKDAKAAECEFDKVLITTLEAEEKVPRGQFNAASQVFEYERFSRVSNQWLNFSKYVLMRIDRYLAQLLDKPSFASTDLTTLETRFNRSATKRHAMHLEHIITQHERNRALFTKDGVFHEGLFQVVRNFLGMVLLLKDKHNLSSNDEVYADKMETYKRSNLIWNELMVGHIPSIDLRALPPELKFDPVLPDANGVFPIERFAERQKAVFQAIKLIWGSF